MKGYRLGATGIIVTFFAIITATVLLPMVLFNPKPSGHGNAYKDTPEATVADPGRGRQIYVREGCVYCHTQFTRLQDRGYGPLVKAGDYVYETPHQLGTARTGPDLTNEGGKFPSEWQKAHLVQPRSVKPGSIMPSFSYLSDNDMNDLVAYIQTLGNNRPVKHYVEAPEEYQAYLARKKVDTNSDAAANGGRGIYTQNCAACHGLDGRGNGPNSISLEKKPANFTRAFYKQYPDEMWFYRVREGVPGTRMPRFGLTLSEEQMWYLVAYLKTLPKDEEVVVDSVDQVNKITPTHLPRLSGQVYEPATGGGGHGGGASGGHEHQTLPPEQQEPALDAQNSVWKPPAPTPKTGGGEHGAASDATSTGTSTGTAPGAGGH
ncbi:MAG: cbb3-type cytochrome c oxidase subunit II [Candidatus Obscuribacterales bacterium]|nr:cbb3-type cytochrome c oxidase subunit II [Candidatus Obscuribacterales bacterium]